MKKKTKKIKKSELRIASFRTDLLATFLEHPELKYEEKAYGLLSACAFLLAGKRSPVTRDKKPEPDKVLATMIYWSALAVEEVKQCGCFKKQKG